MTLFNEALTLKNLAEKALEKGDIEKARRLLQQAKKNLEKLEQTSNDASMRQIWRKAKLSVEEMLNNLENLAEEYSMRSQSSRNQSYVTERQFNRGSSKTETKLKQKTVTKSKAVPKECKSEAFYAEIPDITFADVAGMDDVKKELRETIEWQIKYRDMLEKLKIKPLKGLLMYGPPGTGKTYIVKALAGEFNLPLIIADPATLMSKWVGESEKLVGKMFQCARSMAPSIIFVDEIDKVLPKKTTSSDVSKRIESQFLQELDGVKSGEGFIIIFATNEPWNISPALMRPGRVDRIIYVGPPDDEVRKKMFEIHLKNVPLDPDLDFDKLVELTKPNEEGYYSSSGIAQICNEAKKELMREWIATKRERPLNMNDLIKAMKKVPRSISHKMIKEYKNWGLEQSSFME